MLALRVAGWSASGIRFPRSVHPRRPPDPTICTVFAGVGPLHGARSVAGRCPPFLWCLASVFAVNAVPQPAMMSTVLIKTATNCRAVLMGTEDLVPL